MGKISKKYTNKVYNKKQKGLIYKLGIIISFIFLNLIKPIWGEKDMLAIIKSMVKVFITPEGIIKIDSHRYITTKNGWENMNRYLKKAGYETQILFKDCEFWKDDKERRYIRGKNIGEYFILWKGDPIL